MIPKRHRNAILEGSQSGKYSSLAATADQDVQTQTSRLRPWRKHYKLEASLIDLPRVREA